MESSDYRLMLHKFKGMTLYRIHQVFYREDGSVDYWADEPASAMGQTTEDLRKDLDKFYFAFQRPVLNFVDGKPI